MPDISILLSKTEKKIYLQALAFVLDMNKKDSKTIADYLKAQADEIDVGETMLNQIKANLPEDKLIKELAKISSIPCKRFILREMILLAIADHEVKDEEIEKLHRIGSTMGIAEAKINDFFIWAAQGLEWQLQGIKLVEEDL